MNTRKLCSLLAILFFASGLMARAESSLVVFKAGAGKRDVTPKEPVPMWGYGARHAALSTGTLDPLNASAVVIQAGDNKLAIVGLDLGRSPSEKTIQNIRSRIMKKAGIQYSFIAGSHTHHGPVLELTDEEGKGKGKFDAALRYYKELEDGIVAAILEADSKLVSVRLATGVVKLNGFNRNRHTKIEPKPVDQDLGIIRLDDENGKPVAVIINFAAHPTMVSGGELKFSADFVGALKQTVEKEFGGQAVFMQGAAGDISANKGENKDYPEFGQALGREVVKLANSLKPEQVARPSLVVKEERVTFSSRTDWKNPAIRAAFSMAFFPELIPNYIDEYSDGIRPRLTVALLNGQIAMVGASGEFFCNHSIRLKERARVNQLFFFGYCNGYHQYFPTIEAVGEGGYGADATVSPVEVGAGEKLMNTALTWIYQMQGKIK